MRVPATRLRMPGVSWRRAALLLAVGLAGVAAPAASRAETGGIQILVFDPGGKKPVPGVEVTLSSAERHVATTIVETDAQGVAYFPVLRAGSGYVVGVAHEGYARQELTGIRVRSGQVTRLPVRLAPSLMEKLVVLKPPGTVDLEQAETATRFGGDFIEDLPVMGRFYQDVLRLAAGVQDADRDGNPNVHGARATDFQTQVGGISNQDPLTGEWMSFVNPDSIEELEILTAGAGVEFSRAQGGFANIIQKQGSNDFEGQVGFLWRSDRLDPKSATDSAGVPHPGYQWWMPSVQVAGPILKDRLWYRLSHEWIRVEEPIVAFGMAAVSTRDQTIAADQITWQASPRNKLAFQFSHDPMVLGNLGVNVWTPEASSVRLETGGPTFTLHWTAPMSPSVLVDSVVSWQEGRERILPMQEGLVNDCVADLRNALTGEYLYPALAEGQCLNLGNNRTSGSYPIRQRDFRQRLTVKSQATLFVPRFLGVSHQFRLGLVAENERYFRELRRTPSIEFFVARVPWEDENGRTWPSEVAWWATTIAVPGETRSRVQGGNFGVYAEDMTKPLPNLTVTLGARVDHEEIRSVGFQPFDPAAESADFDRLLPDDTPYSRMLTAREVFTAYENLEEFAWQMANVLGLRVDDVYARLSTIAVSSIEWRHKRRAGNIDLANTNVAPRISVAWDPGSDGKTKVSATAGRYYGAIYLGVAATELGPATTTQTLSGWRLVAGPDTWTNVQFETGLNPAANVQVVDRGLRTPHQDETTLSFEREIFPETSLRLTWVRRRFRDQLQTMDINHYVYDHGTCLVQLSIEQPWVDFSRPDGKIDDCDGAVIVRAGLSEDDVIILHGPDGYADSYTYNPAWGAVFVVGNFNSATYDGWVLDLIRRQYRGWQMQASYTFSKAIGDAEEWLSPLGDDRSVLDAERGYLSYDQRHVVKVSAATITPWGYRLGATASWASGLPYSLLDIGGAYDSLSPQFIDLASNPLRPRIRYPTGQRNDRRNRPTLELNVKVDREWALPGGRSLQTSLEIFNVMNERYYQIYNYDLGMGRQVNGTNEAFLSTGRQYQVGMKLAF